MTECGLKSVLRMCENNARLIRRHKHTMRKEGSTLFFRQFYSEWAFPVSTPPQKKYIPTTFLRSELKVSASQNSTTNSDADMLIAADRRETEFTCQNWLHFGIF